MSICIIYSLVNEFDKNNHLFYYSSTGIQDILNVCNKNVFSFFFFFISVIVCENGTLQCLDSQACYADHAVCDYYDDCGTNYDEFGCPEEGKKLL